MAEILGLGVTHSPLLVGSDDRMAGIFERVLNSERLPAAARDPANWPSADAARMVRTPGRPGRTRASPRARSKGSAPHGRRWTHSIRISS